MRPWIKRTALALLGTTVVLGSLAGCGHRYGHERFSSMSAEDQAKFREKVVNRVSDKLDLSAEQKAKLNALAAKLHEQRMALRGTSDPRADVKSLIAGDKFDRTKAQAMVGEKTAAINTRSPEVIAAFGDFYDSLNATQQAKVREFLERRRGWHRG
ncbi:Spy/CpxP family protein refolding chaperone [Ramlibacter albus]|uniref:Spy/CpxP family protein refolding chaperone n=1 Tax=Ramlibacter albus TaxID=2079448 RepID=A0A923M9X1_9BURK|nr:Spy/CpxP family protein refolding chaperone [Ramlibacter albus]MBC5765583.1 Spy/CpxP family protein refolding chaperone [Ramlibacter albus]